MKLILNSMVTSPAETHVTILNMVYYLMALKGDSAFLAAPGSGGNQSRLIPDRK